jgi:hypothetical protein
VRALALHDGQRAELELRRERRRVRLDRLLLRSGVLLDDVGLDVRQLGDALRSEQLFWRRLLISARVC